MQVLGEMELKFLLFFVFCLDGLGMNGLICTGASFDLHIRLPNVVKK